MGCFETKQGRIIIKTCTELSDKFLVFFFKQKVIIGDREGGRGPKRSKMG